MRRRTGSWWWPRLHWAAHFCSLSTFCSRIKSSGVARLDGQARWPGKVARLQAGPALSWARVPCCWLGGSGPESLLLLLLPPASAPHCSYSLGTNILCARTKILERPVDPFIRVANGDMRNPSKWRQRVRTFKIHLLYPYYSMLCEQWQRRLDLETIPWCPRAGSKLWKWWVFNLQYSNAVHSTPHYGRGRGARCWVCDLHFSSLNVRRVSLSSQHGTASTGVFVFVYWRLARHRTK